MTQPFCSSPISRLPAPTLLTHIQIDYFRVWPEPVGDDGVAAPVSRYNVQVVTLSSTGNKPARSLGALFVFTSILVKSTHIERIPDAGIIVDALEPPGDNRPLRGAEGSVDGVGNHPVGPVVPDR